MHIIWQNTDYQTNKHEELHFYIIEVVFTFNLSLTSTQDKNIKTEEWGVDVLLVKSMAFYVEMYSQTCPKDYIFIRPPAFTG